MEFRSIVSFLASRLLLFPSASIAMSYNLSNFNSTPLNTRSDLIDHQCSGRQPTQEQPHSYSMSQRTFPLQIALLLSPLRDDCSMGVANLEDRVNKKWILYILSSLLLPPNVFNTLSLPAHTLILQTHSNHGTSNQTLIPPLPSTRRFRITLIARPKRYIWNKKEKDLEVEVEVKVAGWDSGV
ncbi:hypothetical protein L218DRAFT_990833 [Marasmius fiardii PR-910]|nr:hypothetical protein L218DRAFT_990833 [Marasmius fiardii PR-910]